MFDFGTLTLPALALLGVVGVGVYVGEDVTMGDFQVPWTVDAAGYNADVLSRRLVDRMDQIVASTAGDLAEVSLAATSFKRSVSEAKSYLELGPVVDAARLAIGTMPFYIDGEITDQGEQTVLTVRINTATETFIVDKRGTVDTLDEMVNDAALSVLEHIAPFTAGVYTRTIEEATGEITFPRTILVAERMLAAADEQDHYLGCALMGRTLMRRAELNTDDPSFEVRKQDYEEALRYFDLSLVHRPNFLYALINKAVILAVLGDYASADAAFADAVWRDPNRLLTRLRWAEMLLKQGLPDQAVYQYVAAVKIAPHDAALRAQLGDVYSQLGAQEEALAQYDLATFLDPANSAYRNVGATLTGTEQ